MTENAINKFIKKESDDLVKDPQIIIDYVKSIPDADKSRLKLIGPLMIDALCNHGLMYSDSNSFIWKDNVLIHMEIDGWEHLGKIFEKSALAKDLIPYCKELERLLTSYCEYLELLCYSKRLLDTPTKHFTGDIVIIEPSGICLGDQWNDVCKFDVDTDILKIELPFETFLVHDTIEGECSYSIINTKNKKEIGFTSVDGGHIGVYLLSDIQKFNSKFNVETNAVLIPNFDGDIQIKVYRNKKYWHGAHCVILGKGINTKTGEPINFTSI